MPTSEDNAEQRRFTRVAFVSHIMLSQNDKQWNGTVVDISFKGILVNCETTIDVDDDNLIMNATIHFENDAKITALLELVHHNGTFYGFCLHEIDSDSLTHLRHIIEYNLVDHDTCERELLSLFSYHQ